MNRLQLMYLEKLRLALKNDAHGEEMVYILGKMREELTATEFQMVTSTLHNSR